MQKIHVPCSSLIKVTRFERAVASLQNHVFRPGWTSRWVSGISVKILWGIWYSHRDRTYSTIAPKPPHNPSPMGRRKLAQIETQLLEACCEDGSPITFLDIFFSVRKLSNTSGEMHRTFFIGQIQKSRV